MFQEHTSLFLYVQTSVANNDDDDDDNTNEKIVLTTMLTIKILFTINSLEKKKNYSFKTLFTIPVDLKST